MRLTIDIPKEFVSQYKDDKFSDSLQRLKEDVHLCAGNYEIEVVDMLIKAFKNANEEDAPKSPTPPHPRPYPEDNQMYFYINPMGEVEQAKWVSDGFDLGAREIGNVFMGETAAEFYAERLTVLAEMNEWAGNWNDRYTISVDPCDGTKLDVFDRFQLWSNGEMRFATEEDAENCIKAVGEDRIKKYYFMIPEEETNNG